MWLIDERKMVSGTLILWTCTCYLKKYIEAINVFLAWRVSNVTYFARSTQKWRVHNKECIS